MPSLVVSDRRAGRMANEAHGNRQCPCSDAPGVFVPQLAGVNFRVTDCNSASRPGHAHAFSSAPVA